MRPLQLLPLHAVSILADGLGDGSHNAYVGISLSGDPIDLISLFSKENLICRVANVPLADSPFFEDDHVDHHHHAWTHSSPCIGSKRTDQEYCVFSDSSFAENRGTALVTTAKRAAHMARNPAFTDPEVTRGTNQDLVRTTPASYRVEQIEGKGMGVVAARFINRGELIMANTASLLIDYGVFNHLNKEEYVELEGRAIEALPAAHRERIMGLSTHVDARNFTYLEQVARVVSTNAFDISPDEDEDEDEDVAFDFHVVFPEIARMNHDCRPSAEYYYEHASLTQRIHAVRPIFPGEEITISYIEQVQPRAARAARLRETWGFECACASCTASGASGAASDARVGQAEELVPELRDHGAGSRATPRMAELLVSLYEQERLYGLLYEAYVYAAVEWNAAGEPWTATKYARLAVEYGIFSVGEGDPDVRDMDSLAMDPWKHWSWMLRTRQRTESDEREREET